MNYTENRRLMRRQITYQQALVRSAIYAFLLAVPAIWLIVHVTTWIVTAQ